MPQETTAEEIEQGHPEAGEAMESAMEAATPAKPFGDRELDFVLEARALTPAMANRRCLVRERPTGSHATGATPYWIWSPERGTWSGYCKREEAVIQTVKSVIDNLCLRSEIIEILKDGPAVPMVEGQKCWFYDQFSEDFIKLIELQPNNPVVRAHMMRVLKIEPPKEIKTYSELVHWVEFNCQPASSAPVKNEDNCGQAVSTPTPTRAAPRVQAPHVEVVVDCSQTETGKARYRRNKYCTEGIEVDMEMLQTWIEDGETIDGIMDRINELADEESHDWERDEMVYSEQEMEYTEDYSSHIPGRESAEASILRFIREHNPELADQLEGN